MNYKLIKIFFLIILTLLMQSSVFAQNKVNENLLTSRENLNHSEPLTFGEVPKYTLDENNNVIKDSFVISNASKDQVPYQYSVSVVNTLITSNGNIVPSGDSNIDPPLAKYIEIEPKEFVLEPDEKQTVNFTITGDETISPGTYSFSIATTYNRAKQKNEIKGSGLSFSVRRGQNMFVYVPGEASSNIDVGELILTRSNDNIKINQDFLNTGNTLLRSYGEISIERSNGENEKILIESGLIPQNTERKIAKTIENKILYGKININYSVNIEEFSVEKNQFISYKKIEQKKEITIYPFTEIIYGLIGISVVLLLLFIKLLISHHYLKNCHIYTVKDNENIYQIAEKFKMNWKKLAKINKLKAPYIMEAGKHILVKDQNAKKSKK
ncbi:LysM peptidoglycan-binding domain-containing protein [Candidatus Peregrinibacteria bacterium]|nr:LysM peptidoglycan-binding domain-containing protein [Candidatus Peregrinibacteria bacterium]